MARRRARSRSHAGSPRGSQAGSRRSQAGSPGGSQGARCRSQAGSLSLAGGLAWRLAGGSRRSQAGSPGGSQGLDGAAPGDLGRGLAGAGQHLQSGEGGSGQDEGYGDDMSAAHASTPCCVGGPGAGYGDHGGHGQISSEGDAAIAVGPLCRRAGQRHAEDNASPHSMGRWQGDSGWASERTRTGPAVRPTGCPGRRRSRLRARSSGGRGDGRGGHRNGTGGCGLEAAELAEQALHVAAHGIRVCTAGLVWHRRSLCVGRRP
jgi:hypothetical protein